MRLHVFGPLALAALITVGAGCASSSNVDIEVESGIPGVEVEVETSGGAAAGTQLEGTPAVNDTPDADIDLEADAQLDVATGTVKTFTVTANNFAYDVKEMKVKKGDKVRVVFKNAEGFHDWVLDEFAGAKTAKYQAGGTETIEFTADKAGTFEYYCSVGSHRQMGMKGNLIVE